jgi:hypothetical protein
VKTEEVKKIDDLIKESDTRTPAERSADSLDAIKKDIAFIGQGGKMQSDGSRVKTEQRWAKNF